MFCGSDLNYGPIYFLDVVNSLKEAKSVEEWKSLMRSVFVSKDAEELIRLRDEAEQQGIAFKPPLKLEVERPINIWSNDARFVEKTIMEYLSDYGGNPKSDYVDLITNLNTELVFKLVYDPINMKYFRPNDPDKLHLGYTEINYKLRELRESFAKRLIELLDLKYLKDYKYSYDPISFTNFINLTLAYSQSELVKMGMSGTIPLEVRSTFIKLASFDEFLEQSGFISLNPEAELTSVITKDRYIFTGETIDYGKSMFEEHADAHDYTSKLVKIILDSIDCLDFRGKPTVKLGLNGFNEAMSEVCEWARSGKNPTAFNLITIKNKNVDYNRLIDLYIRNNPNAAKTIKFALKGIQTFLFNDNVPIPIKEMFISQTNTTVRGVYLEYKMGTTTVKTDTGNVKRLGIVMNPASSKIIEDTKVQLVERIRSKIEYLNSGNGEKQKSAIISKYKIVFNPRTKILKFYLPGTDKAIEITYNKSINKFTITAEIEHLLTDPNLNLKWAKMLNEILDLPLSDVSIFQIIKDENIGIPTVGHAFKDALAVTLWNIVGNNAYDFAGSDLKWGPFFAHVTDATKVMMRIIESEFSTMVSDQNGHKLPTHQMVSLAYRTAYNIADIRKAEEESRTHVLSENMIANHPEILGITALRESVEVYGRVKKSSELNTSELMQVDAMTDFYNNLMSDDKDNGKCIYIQPMTYSDKSRHILYQIMLKGLKIEDKDASIIFRELSNNFGYTNNKKSESVQHNEDRLYKEIQRLRYDQAKKSIIEKLYRFGKVFNVSIKVDTHEDIVNSVELINSKLGRILYEEKQKDPENFKDNTIKRIQDLFYDRNVDFLPENDINRDFTFNSMLMSTFENFKNLESTKRYFKRIKIQYAKDLIKSGFTLDRFKDPSLKTYFSKLDSKESGSWIDFNAGIMKLFKFRNADGVEIEFNPELSWSELEQLGEIELNPVLNGLFFSNALFGQQLRTLQMGADYNIASKSTEETSDIESRFIAESKRAMGQGSTVTKFETGRTFGMGQTANMAAYEDVVDSVYNPQGTIKKELVSDGGGFINPEQSVLEEWSLPGNSRLKIDVRKSIIQHVDDSGNLQQVKWAGTTISNRLMRMNPHSNFSMKEMYRLMSNKRILINFDLSKYYGDFVTTVEDRSITCTEKLYYKDINTGKYYRINSVSSNGINKGIRNITEVDVNGKDIGDAFDETLDLNSLYDIFNFFGGEYCMNFNHAYGNLDYTEMNHNILAYIICVQNLKDSFVGYVVNKSAYKVGMRNINQSNVFESRIQKTQRLKKQLYDYYSANPDKIPDFLRMSLDGIWSLKDDTIEDLAVNAGFRIDLWTHTMDMSNSGIQLDSGHSIEDGKVTEMSQLVNLLIEKGYCTDIVAEIYNNIADVTDAGMLRFKEGNVKSIISEILADSLKVTNANINSITDDFIKHLQARVKEEGINLELPFSSPSIRSKFATSVCASINSAALRRKYPGIGAVQTPAYGIAMTTKIGGFNYEYEEVVDMFRPHIGTKIDSIEDLFYDKTSLNPNEVSAEYVNRLQQCIYQDYDGSILSPMSKIDNPLDIKPEDTIVYADIQYDVNGIPLEPIKFNVVRVSDPIIYDDLRHFSRNRIMYRWNTRPCDLVQQLNYFKTVDGIYSIYDLDEFRISLYLSNPETWIGTNKEAQVRQFLLIHGIDFSVLSKEAIEQIAKLNLETMQERLNKLDSETLKFITINGEAVRVLETISEGAEVVIDYPYKKEFNIRDSDHFSDILKRGESFFFRRISEKYKLVSDVPTSGYDAVLYADNGERILIQFGGDENINRLPAQNMALGNSFVKNGNLRYKGEDLGSSDGVSEFVYLGGSGNPYKVLRLKDPSKINSLLKTKLFTDVRYNISQKHKDVASIFELIYKNRVKGGVVIRSFNIGNFRVKAGSDINKVFTKYKSEIIPQFIKERNAKFEKKISKLAKEQNIAFLKTLECVGTRIPSQTLQSCAKLKLVGFSKTGSNHVFLPRILTWIAGSDFDIDKLFIMMFGVTPDGRLPNTSGINNPNYHPLDVSRLPKTTGEEFDIVVSDTVESGEIPITETDVEAVIRGGDAGIAVLSSIINARKEGGDLMLTFVSDDFSQSAEGKLTSQLVGRNVTDVSELSDPVLRDKIEAFMEILNAYSTNDKSKYNKSFREKAERNAVLGGMLRALSTNAVQIGLQTPVSMDAGKKAAKKYGIKEESYLNWDNPYCKFKQQEDNMVGKNGIAAVAVANKAFNNISFSFNITANNLADRLSEDPSIAKDFEKGNKWVKDLLSICIERKEELGGGYISLANINFSRLIDAAKQNPIIYGVYVPGYSQDGGFNLLQFVEDIQEYANRIDGTDMFSNIMSAATDNAKELLLAKLNAIGENIDLYTFLFATGYNFDEAAETMLSREFQLVSKYAKPNIFEEDSHRLRPDNVIKFFLNQDHLPTVDKTLLRSIITDLPLSISPKESYGLKSPLLCYLLTRPDLEGFQKSFIAKVNELSGGNFAVNSDNTMVVLEHVIKTNTVKDSLFEKDGITELEKWFLEELGNEEYGDSVKLGLNKWLVSWIQTKEEGKVSDLYDDIAMDSEDDYDTDPDYSSKYIHQGIGYKNASADQLRKIYSYFNYKLYPKYRDLRGVDNSKFPELLELIKSADEFAILGRKILSSNQGMKVGEYESWSWIRQIDSAINGRFVEKNIEFEEFSFVKFMRDEEYADRMIKQYDKIKSNVNILKAVKDSPHFKSMLNAIVETEKLLENSYAIKITRDIASRVLDGINVAKTNVNGVTVSTYSWKPKPSIRSPKINGEDNRYYDSCKYGLWDSEWKALSQAVNEHLILNFFMHLEDSISLPIFETQLDKIYVDKDGIVSAENALNTEIRFNTIEGLATFKRWMDNFFIPKLKDFLMDSGAQNSKPNYLADTLCLQPIENKTYGTKKYAWGINADIRKARPGEVLFKKKSNVVSDFNEIMQTKISAILGTDYTNSKFTIGDLMYLYNLYVYKDSPSGMTFLFSDAAASGNKSEWVNNYQRYIVQLDYGKIKSEGELIEIDPRDIMFKLVNDTNAYKYKGRFSKEGDYYFITYDNASFKKPSALLTNSDFLFEIPSVYESKFYPVEWSGFNPFEYITLKDGTTIKRIPVTGQDVLHEVLNHLNNTLQIAGIKVHEISDSELPMLRGNMSDDEYNRMVMSRGFVLNGEIYINISDRKYQELNDSPISYTKTLMHELVHIICANLHYNPKYKDTYYKAIQTWWDRAPQRIKEDYMTRYPNKQTTDLMEEYFAHTIAEAFNSNFSKQFEEKWNGILENGVRYADRITADQLKHDVIESIKSVFKLDDKIDTVDFNKLGGTDITQICHMFQSALFDFNKLGFNTTTVVLSQGLATLKNQLMKDNKIIKKC